MFVGEFELSRCFSETGDGRRSIDHLFPSRKQSLRGRAAGSRLLNLADCSSRLPPPVVFRNSSMFQTRFSLAWSPPQEVPFRLRHFLGKFRYVHQRWPRGIWWSGEIVRRGNVWSVADEPPNVKSLENRPIHEHILVLQRTRLPSEGRTSPDSSSSLSSSHPLGAPALGVAVVVVVLLLLLDDDDGVVTSSSPSAVSVLFPSHCCCSSLLLFLDNNCS